MDETLRILFRDLADRDATERQREYRARMVPAGLQRELESLLAFDESGEEANDLLLHSVGSAAEELLQDREGFRAGSRCGPYRLLRLLGSGGMGAVFLAERDDGEIQQSVAIKLLRRNPYNTFKERFLRERQILASLSHPNISRLLDAGHAEGQPYLVMEYIEGQRIDEYSAKLDSRGIAAMFLQVAEAVSYAHGNLIIHCDLKPSNILIDGAGTVKLLDFGIAKMLDAPGDTRTLERILTPEFASPEQLQGSVNSTATDIYSLGAVLRHLLGPEATRDRDLAAILAQATRNEPGERYASASLFAADLRAYLEGRPVAARRGDALYRARKFLRRYWLAATALALAMAGLTVGLVIAQREKARAEMRFAQVRKIAVEFLNLNAQIRSLPGATAARQRIVTQSLDYLSALGRDVNEDPQLSLEIARAYLEVARVQGVPGQITLGQFPEALESLNRAARSVSSALTGLSGAERQEATRLAAAIHHDTMTLRQTKGDNAEAWQEASRTLHYIDLLLASSPVSREDEAEAARLLVNVGLTYLNTHRAAEAARAAERAVALGRHANALPATLGRALGVLANSRRFSGDLENALAAIEESRAIAERDLRPNDVPRALVLAGALWREALILGEKNNINLGREDAAIPLLERSLSIADGLADKDPRDYTTRTYVAMTGVELGDILRDRSPGEALRVYGHVLRRLAEAPANKRLDEYAVWALTGSSYALDRLGRPVESTRRLDQALDLLRRNKAWPAKEISLGEEADAYLRARAAHEIAQRRPQAALALLQDLERLAGAAKPSPESDLRHANGVSRLYAAQAEALRLHGKTAAAAQAEAKRIALWRMWERKLPRNAFVQRQLAVSSHR